MHAWTLGAGSGKGECPVGQVISLMPCLHEWRYCFFLAARRLLEDLATWSIWADICQWRSPYTSRVS
jgi:hypothetical protein